MADEVSSPFASPILSRRGKTECRGWGWGCTLVRCQCLRWCWLKFCHRPWLTAEAQPNYSACAPTPLSQKTLWRMSTTGQHSGRWQGHFLGRGTMVVVFKHRETMLRLSEFENGGENLSLTFIQLAHNLRAAKGYCLPSRVDLPQCFVHYSWCNGSVVCDVLQTLAHLLRVHSREEEAWPLSVACLLMAFSSTYFTALHSNTLPNWDAREQAHIMWCTWVFTQSFW